MLSTTNEDRMTRDDLAGMEDIIIQTGCLDHLQMADETDLRVRTREKDIEGREFKDTWN